MQGSMVRDPARRTMRDLWRVCREQLQGQLYLSTWELNVRPLKATQWAHGVLTLEAPNEQAAEVCRERLDRVIRREISVLAGRPVAVEYVVRETHPHPNPLPGGEGTGAGTGQGTGQGRAAC